MRVNYEYFYIVIRYEYRYSELINRIHYVLRYRQGSERLPFIIFLIRAVDRLPLIGLVADRFGCFRYDCRRDGRIKKVFKSVNRVSTI